MVRLHQVSYSFQAHKETGRGVAANRLAGIAGFAPTTFHAIGSRVAAAESAAASSSAITNVPGPQSPLYAAGARMVRTYPVPPLLPGQTLAIGVTSYDGQVFYGITADRDLVPDADVLGQCVTEALDELLDTATGGRPKIPRGRTQEDRTEAVIGSTSPPRWPGWPGSATTARCPPRRSAYVADGDSEEQEYAALMAAAADVRRAARRAPAGGSSWSPTWPTRTATVPLRDVVAVHADPADRPAGADPDDDLAWYATQEIDAVLSD